MKTNYVPYHLHSDRSLLDSCTDYHDYIDKAVEYNMKAICFSEHGNIYNWIDKKMYCDKKGIKYLHGCEVYLTEKLYSYSEDENTKEIKKTKIRDNYHTILIAKNMKGLKELNLLIGNATDEDHMYYKPRITFDEFLSISNNIISISACMASPLNNLSENNIYYEKLLNKYDFYEIQYHIDSENKQIKYNQKLYELSKKYNKPLITGTDTHSLNKYKAECRKILKKAKKMSYDNEDEFDLTFKSYNELVEMFKKQDSLDMDIVLDAINNTNKLSNMCDEIILDSSIKYPKLSDNDEELFDNTIFNKLKDKMDKNIIPKDKVYLDRIKEESRVFKKLDMCSFMLFMSTLISWCKDNGIPVGFCRGSVGGSLIAYILDIIDVNPIVWGTVFSRFANESRKEIGDIDCDISPSQRKLVYEYIINSFGIDKSAYVLAIGTISDKGTIDDIGRALSEKWKDSNEEYQKELDNIQERYRKYENDEYGMWTIDAFGWDRLKNIDKNNNPYSLSNIAKIKEEYEVNPEYTRKRYPDIFYYFDGLKGTAISQSMHPAGIIASPITLPDNYGCFWDKEGHRILYINMEEIHDGAGLVKYDILGLKNIEIIKDTCNLLSMPYPKSNEINWSDENVWKHIIDSPVGIFQFESKFAFESMKRFKPNTVNDLAMLSAILRPGATTIRERFLNREVNHNPSEIIDELFKNNNGWLIFQEDTIAFLQQICGLNGSEADNIRRAIGRKQKERLDDAMPSILEGYCNKSNQTREVAEREAKEFLDIISSSSDYQFGKNHSTGYSMITYLCAYLRYHYPLEFVTSYLNNANNDEDIIMGTQLANQFNIKINPPKFRYSKFNYFPSRETNSIYKGISSIKFCNEQIGKELYKLKDNKYNTFLDLLIELQNTSVNSRQLEILIKLNYFEEFGKTKYLLKIVDIYNKIYTKKQFKKLGLSDENQNLIRKYSEKETEKMFTKVDTDSLAKEIIKNIPNESLPIKELMISDIEYLGYISYIDKSYPNDISIVAEIKINTWGTPFLTLYQLSTGKSTTIKTNKKYYENKPLNQFDMIKIVDISSKNKKRKDKETGKWIQLEEKENILESYSIIIE